MMQSSNGNTEELIHRAIREVDLVRCEVCGCGDQDEVPIESSILIEHFAYNLYPFYFDVLVDSKCR